MRTSGSIGFSYSTADRWAADRGIAADPVNITDAAAIEAMFADRSTVVLPTKSDGSPIIIDRAVNVPAGKALIAQHEGESGLKLAASATSRSVVNLGDGAVVSGLVLDGSLDERELSGTLTDYVWAVNCTNVNDTTTHRIYPVNVGCTDAEFALNGGNGGGWLCAINETSTGDVTGNVLDGLFGDLPKAGFHLRMQAPFQGAYASHGSLVYNSLPIFLTGNKARNIKAKGCRKNNIELVGTATTCNLVEDFIITDPLGQASAEADFGANMNRLRNGTVIISKGKIVMRTHYCFNQVRSANDRGDRSYGNMFEDCNMMFFGQLGTGSIHFAMFYEQGASTDLRIIRPNFRSGGYATGIRKEAGATGTVSFYLNNENFAAGRNTYIEQPSVFNVDRGFKFTGSQAIDKVTVNGGHVYSRGSLIEKSNTGTVGSLEFTGTIKLQQQPALNGTTGAVTGSGTGDLPVTYGSSVLGPTGGITNPIN